MAIMADTVHYYKYIMICSHPSDKVFQQNHILFLHRQSCPAQTQHKSKSSGNTQSASRSFRYATDIYDLNINS